MAGTSWPALTGGKKAKASEVESRFDWIEGDLLPQSSGTKATRTFDLGSPSWYWRNLYFSSQIKCWSNGTPGIPNYASYDSTTGIYFDAVDNICFSKDGVQVIQVEASGTAFYNHQIWGEGTTTAQPFYSFDEDRDTGFGYEKGISGFPVSLVNSGAAVLRGYNDGHVECVRSPGFEAYWNTSTSNCVGSGTSYTLTAQWTEVYDTLGNFSSGVFLVPITGKYHVDAHIRFSIINNSMSGCFLSVASFDDREIYSTLNPNSTKCLHINTNAQFTAGDRIYMVGTINGGTMTAEITGHATSRFTWFSIRMIP